MRWGFAAKWVHCKFINKTVRFLKFQNCSLDWYFLKKLYFVYIVQHWMLSKKCPHLKVHLQASKHPFLHPFVLSSYTWDNLLKISQLGVLRHYLWLRVGEIMKLEKGFLHNSLFSPVRQVCPWCTPRTSRVGGSDLAQHPWVLLFPLEVVSAYCLVWASTIS